MVCHFLRLVVQYIHEFSSSHILLEVWSSPNLQRRQESQYKQIFSKLTSDFQLIEHKKINYNSKK